MTVKTKYTNNILIAAALFFLVIAGFGYSLKLGYMWDDHQMIENNPYIKSLSFKNISHIFTSDPFNQELNYYRPVVSASFIIDFALWKYNPSLSRFVNILLHSVNSVLVFFLVMLLTKNRPISIITAILFSVNPIITEQMMIVICRMEFLSTTFSLASILLFFRKTRTSYILSLLLFVFAFLSKESGLAVPLSIICVLIYKRSASRDYTRLISYLLLVPPYLLLRQYALGHGVLNFSLPEALSFIFLRFPKVLLEYASITLMPLNLHSHRLSPTDGYLSILYIILISVVLFYMLSKRKHLYVFCGLWYLSQISTKIPMLISNVLMLEHWVYLANTGIFLALASLAVTTGERSQKVKKAVFTAIACYTVFCLSVSNYNIHIRGGDLKLYEHAARFTTSKPLYYNLAREYYMNDDVEKAYKYSKILTKRAPENTSYRNLFALVLIKQGDLTKAEGILRETNIKHPRDTQTLYNLSHLYMLTGRKDAGMDFLYRIIKIAPDEESAHMKLARIYLEDGNKNIAEGLYKSVLKINPYNTEALVNLGALAAEKNEHENAGRLWQRALSMDKNNRQALSNISRLRRISRDAKQKKK